MHTSAAWVPHRDHPGRSTRAVWRGLLMLRGARCREVKTLLTKAGRPLNYRVIRHAAVVTAAETARELGLPGCAVIKAVAVRIDGTPALCVLCSHQLLDLERVEKLAGAVSVELASPRELRAWFPHVEVRLTPPPVPCCAVTFQCPLSVRPRTRHARPGAHARRARPGG